ncbi:ATP-dependent DNA helicase pcrA [Gemella morbillorum]|uniref:ATP-dependent helicase n=1 Tax=Gemella morbillorum TaxID=29391 RepID=UPI000DA35551|nr:ATP-dependent helicase [Gemella morbillorum]UBH80457.1 ATP-dependent helicase [Gemella morbillorum]SQH55852.1 ATP-dependent DNA helicase pcrA [Gemella morbillorum]
MYKYLESLNNEQLEAVLSNDNEIMLVAGAGTGKTNTIVKKIIYLIKEQRVIPYNILAVTFTNKAVREIRERVNNSLCTNHSGVVVNTFHQLAKSILDKDDNYQLLGYKSLKILEDEGREKILDKIIKYNEMYNRVNEFNKTIKGLLIDFNAKKNNRYIESSNKEYEELFKELYHAYVLEVFANGYIELDDLVNLVIVLLERYPEIRKEVSSAFDYIFVDEYQDVNKEQYKLIKLLKNKNKVLIVGDEDQAIYGWRGSNSKYFRDFQSEYPDCRVIKLERNYRSTQQILNLADGFIKQNKNRIDKTLKSDKIGVLPDIQEISSKENQIEFLFDQIQKLGSNKNDIAILIRNRDFDYLSDLKLKFVKNDIGYTMVGEFPLLKRKIIKDLMAVLKFLITDTDNISLSRIIKNMKLGLGEQFYNKIEEISVEENIKSYYHIMKNHEKYADLKRYSSKIESFIEKFKDYNMEKSFVIIIEKVVEEFFDEVILSEYHYLQEFIREANRYYEKNGYMTLNEYLDYIQYFKDTGKTDKVQIMTMHASKGLEYKNVFVVNLHEKYPMLNKANYEKLDKNDLAGIQVIEEERRLLYVAMTRAKERLFVLGSADNIFIKELKEIQENV